MPSNPKKHRHNTTGRFSKTQQVVGLHAFESELEKHFFSNIQVRNYSTSETEVSLIIEIDCNLELIEVLDHFNKDMWGNFSSKKSSLSGALLRLQDTNDCKIDIEEFSLFLNDTSIIINKIYNQSIPQQLENVFLSLSKHCIYFTKGMTEIPYEIFISVFENNMMLNEKNSLNNLKAENIADQSYFSFWGLYFYSEIDASVFDLKNQTIINGKLQMLNR